MILKPEKRDYLGHFWVPYSSCIFEFITIWGDQTNTCMHHAHRATQVHFKRYWFFSLVFIILDHNWKFNHFLCRFYFGLFFLFWASLTYTSCTMQFTQLND